MRPVETRVLPQLTPEERFSRAAPLAQGLRSLSERRAARAAAAQEAFTRGSARVASIAVLPFVNTSADRDNEFLSGGIAEDLMSALSGLPGLRVSFVKVLELFRPLWLTLELGEDLLSERQKDQLVQRFNQHMGRCVTPQRRSRSCPRAVRQPVTGWPRLQWNESVEGPLHFRLI